MRPDGSPLDLNHLPEDFTRDGKQGFEDPSTSGQRKKKNNGKDESEKVYECRFCSLKFCKSQALGGHMNRHRQGLMQHQAPPHIIPIPIRLLTMSTQQGH
uniref:C2H2-type domain-containing protein n=1 Tax=Opuntia streptacantha TaxID=393608 RepID=A0A7C8ZMP1_OPUST